MCGIAGLYHFDIDKPINEKKLIEMRDILHHRGPDDAGFFIDNNIGLAHRRLSIIDLSEDGRQPFYSPDGRYVMVYNGEIFNYLEIRAELENNGEVFKTKTDTEVLLRLYIIKGLDALHQLNGMFAFVIWDNFERTFTVVRDRIGIKPLYFSVFNNTFYFASEPKAIIIAGVPIDLFKDGFEELLIFKYIAGENTIFKNIKRLLPGHLLIVKSNGDIINKRWWNLPEIIAKNREIIPKDPFKWFEETFYSSVKYRTISDVPVGLMLSGGLDSGSIAVALSKIDNTNISAFTVEFLEADYNEGHLAKGVAEKFGLKYHPILITGQDLKNTLKEAAWLYDEPLVHNNDAQMLALSKKAKQHVTVLLSGEGGDEFMGGYVRYKTLKFPRLLKLASNFNFLLNKIPSTQIVNRFNKIGRYLADPRLESLINFNVSNIYPNDLIPFGYKIDFSKFEYRNTVKKEANDIYPKEPARQAMYIDLFVHMASVLDRNDRMTMGAGIECRVPYMDHHLMEMIPALPSSILLKGKKGKFLLAKTVARHLPENVLKFKKLGFSVPWDTYLKNDISFDIFLEKIKKNQPHPIFENLQTKDLYNNFIKGDSVSSFLVRQLFMTDEWFNNYYDKIKSKLADY